MRTPLIGGTISPVPGTISQKACQRPLSFIFVNGGRSKFQADRQWRQIILSAQSFGRDARGRNRRALRHFASTLAALRIGDQRAISAFTKASNFAGVRSSLLGNDPPRSDRRLRTPGSSSA